MRPIPPVRTALALALAAPPLAPPARAGLRAEVVDRGEVTAENDRPAPPTPDDDALEPRMLVDGVEYLTHADRIEARLCSRFGVTIRLVPDPGERLPDRIVVRVTHPRTTRPDGASSTQDSFPSEPADGTIYAGWTFDHAWELQPGPWTFTFLWHGDVLASQEFTVTVPRPVGTLCPSKPVASAAPPRGGQQLRIDSDRTVL